MHVLHISVKDFARRKGKKFISLVLLFSIPNAATATSVHFEITINFFQKRKKKETNIFDLA